VIIPCYKQAHYLPEAVDSALQQTYPRVEVVVVNDGSPDDTAVVARKYGDRIVYVEQDNAGLPAARNAGIRRSSGELVAFLDSDDRWLPRKLERQVPLFADKAVGLVHGGYRSFDESGIRWETSPELNEGDAIDLHRLLTGNRLGVLTAVARRDALVTTGGFDETLTSCEDWDLWIRIVARYQVRCWPEVVAEYRLQSASMSRNYRRMYRMRRAVLRKNSRLHGRCPDCDASVRMGLQRARAMYLDSVWPIRERCTEAWHAGHPVSAVRYYAEAIGVRPGLVLSDAGRTVRHICRVALSRWRTA
jgi:glycosyltransferase involved in cell wall biosynthesis